MRRLIAALIVAVFALPALAAALSTYTVPQGGTGATSFTSSNLLYGAGTSPIKTVATSSPTAGTGISLSGSGSVVGGSLTITNTGVTSNAGDWAGTWQTFSPSHFQVAGTYLTSYDAFTHPTATSFATTSGAVIAASSTIGDGTQAGGLTVSGGATTTGNSLFQGTSQFNGNLNIGTNIIYGNSFGSGDYLQMNGASGYTLQNGNNGWGINIGADYLRLIGGGIGQKQLQWSTDTNLSRYAPGVLELGNGTYQDASGGLLLASSTMTNLTAAYASTTAISGTTFCISTDCRTVWPAAVGLSTTSPIADSNLLVYSTLSGGRAYGVATGTVSAGTGISLDSSVRSVIGGSLQITNSSPLSGLSAAYPFSFSNPTLSWIGLATSSGLTAGKVHYSTGVNTFADVATSSIANGTGITVTNGSTAFVIGSQPTINCNTANGSTFGCLTSTDWTTFNNKQTPGFQISTTTVPSFSIGNLAYLTGTTPTSIGGVATSSLGVTGPITFSGTLGAQVGGAAGNFGCATCVTTSRNVNTTFPLQGGGALSGDLTLSSAFGTTTNTGLTANGLVYTDNGGIFKIAASSSLALPNSALANSTISGVALGSNLNNHTHDSTLTGTSYNGSAAVSDWGIDLTHANSWTGKQTITSASTTNLTASTYFELPAVTTAPSFTVAGQLVVNKNSTASSSISFADGTNNHNIFAVHSYSVNIASSTLTYYGSYVNGTSPYFLFGNSTASTTATLCSTTGKAVSYASNNTFTGRQNIYIAIGTSAGTTTMLLTNPLHASTLRSAYCSMDAATPNLFTITADVEDSN